MHAAGRSLFLALFGLSALEAQQYSISTLTGGTPPPASITGSQASIALPAGVAADQAGNIYFSAIDCVFKVDTNGVMSRVAGNSREGYSGDGAAATAAQLNTPFGVAVDANGNVYIADRQNNRIRKVSAAGIITTVAGNGSAGFSGDGAAATSAQLSSPAGIAVDGSGNVYIADYFNNRIRRVSTAGTITTVAGTGSAGYSGDAGPASSAQLNSPMGVAVDSSGNLYIADYNNQVIRKVSASGTISTIAGNGSIGYSGDGGAATSAQLSFPAGVAVDSAGNLYIADSQNNVVRKVNPAATISTLAGNGTPGYTGDGGAPAAAQLWSPFGVAVDAAGNVYIADYYNNRVRKASSSAITTVGGNGSEDYSGDGGPAASAQAGAPAYVVVDGGGNLYVSDYANNRVRQISAAGMIKTVAGNGTAGYSGDGGQATSAQLNSPGGLALDSGGNLYIADTSNHRIRKVSPGGAITTVAGAGVQGFAGDGGPATAARLSDPYGVAVDAAGDLFIADFGNHRIREVTPAGMIFTVAGNGSAGYSGDGGPAINAQLDYPTDIALDANGNLYIADSYNRRIREVSAAGVITTVAGSGANGNSGDGGPAISAQLSMPYGVAIDSAGALYIADPDNHGVRKVSGGIISTIAGNGSEGYSGDGGPGTTAQLSSTEGVAIGANGNVYIGDANDHAVRLLTPSGAACSWSVSSMSITAPVAGGNSSVALTTGSGCLWDVSNLPDWITLSGPATGSGGADITLVVSGNNGAPRSAEISIAGIAVTVSQASSVLSISAGGVVSAADYTPRVAPGSIAAVFGNFLIPSPIPVTAFPLPTVLGGDSFQFDGAPPAPMFYAGAGQVNMQIPWELADHSQTTITASASGATGAPVTVTLAAYAPGIFAMNGQGTGQGAVLDSNYRLVDPSNPATAGSTSIQIYCTGLGPVTNQPATGQPASSTNLSYTIAQPTVMIGGVPAVVQFSGLTPTDVGLYQVNALVPQGSAKGNAVPLMISIGGVSSNVVTIAVQ